VTQFLALLVPYVLFLGITLLFYKIVLRKSNVISVLLSVAYLFGIYWYYRLLIKLDYILIDHQIYLGYGHAHLGLLLLMFFCYINALILFLILIAKKNKLEVSDSE